MHFPSGFLDEIRARLPVSEVVGRHVKLKRRGREFVGLSPFKQEKTPSFTVNDQKGFYHCFASGEHGDIFGFLMKMEGLSFPEAVERLAGEAGIPMPRSSPEMQRRAEGRARLLELMEEACRFFEAALQAPHGRTARQYIEERAITPDQRAAFRMGFAPSSRTALKEYLAARGFSQDDMIKAGVIISGSDIAIPYDRFRNRLMFPITDLKGKIIAFGGRALEAGHPAKYLNSPETPLFHKSAVLYNAAVARQAAYEAETLIAVEGYMDVIALAGAGFTYSVAPLGTALTREQISLMWRMTREPILCFDGDEAGRKAAYRAVDTALPLLKPGYSIRFAFLPEGQDPDDVIRSEGRDAFSQILKDNRALIDVLWVREEQSGDWTTPERRAAFEQQLEQAIQAIQNGKIRDHYQQELAIRLEKLWQAQGLAKNRDVASGKFGRGRTGHMARSGRSHSSQYTRNIIPGGSPYQPASKMPASSSLRESALVRGSGVDLPIRETSILTAVIVHPWLLDDHLEEIADIVFESRNLAGLRDAVLSAQVQIETNSPLDSGHLRAHLKQNGFDNLLTRMARMTAHGREACLQPETEREDVLAAWRQMLRLHHRSIALRRELIAAEQAYHAQHTEENFTRLKTLRLQFLDADGMQAGTDDSSDGAPNSAESDAAPRKQADYG